MIPMSKRLQGMGGLSHAIYADDVTIWTVLPSPYMGNTIKAEADTVKEEAAAIGLECAADKSALLIRTPRHGSSNNDMDFYLNSDKSAFTTHFRRWPRRYGRPKFYGSPRLPLGDKSCAEWK